MLKQFHVELTRMALGERLSTRALGKIIDANVAQDRLGGQIGHDEYHFDNKAFDKSHAYLEEQRALTISSLEARQVHAAWSAFGRLIHSAQDFYAHSNYIDLWLSCQKDGARPAPSEVDPIDPDLMDSQALRSGRIYLPLEVLTIVGALKPLALRFLPRDSHAWMNLDSPDQGPNFKYAFQAALKRTKIEYNQTTRDLAQDLLSLFVDM